ncbi:MAG: helix-turn-helix domain-containing protein [Clostridia bacterium]|nr:helix-turn-helix domain-containing protein [Clostridia bacterium]
MNHFDIFSERLAYALEKREVGVEELSKRTGIGKKTLYGYLIGDRLPRYESLISIARTLHISLDWLCGMRVKEAS